MCYSCCNLLFLPLFPVPVPEIAGIARAISAISHMSVPGIAGIANLTIPGAISPTSEWKLPQGYMPLIESSNVVRRRFSAYVMIGT